LKKKISTFTSRPSILFVDPNQYFYQAAQKQQLIDGGSSNSTGRYGGKEIWTASKP
jgi:hypothetical protein